MVQKKQNQQTIENKRTFPAISNPLPKPRTSSRRRGVSCRIMYDGILRKPLARL